MTDPSHSPLSVASILKESAERRPDSVAVVVGPTETTYAELWQQARSYAGALSKRGVSEGMPSRCSCRTSPISRESPTAS